MNDIYCLWTKPQKGVPIFLDGVLAEKFDPKNPMPPMNYSWTRNRLGKKIDYPKELWLIVKEKSLLFDYYPCFRGIIVSDVFLNIMKENTSEEFYQIVKLNTVSWKGKEVTPKKYFYLRFYKEESLFDYEKSEYVLENDVNMENVLTVGSGIKYFKEIFLNNNISNTRFFILRDRMFNKYLFCNSSFRLQIEKAGLYGFEILHYKALPHVYNEKNKAYI